MLGRKNEFKNKVKLYLFKQNMQKRVVATTTTMTTTVTTATKLFSISCITNEPSLFIFTLTNENKNVYHFLIMPFRSIRNTQQLHRIHLCLVLLSRYHIVCIAKILSYLRMTAAHRTNDRNKNKVLHLSCILSVRLVFGVKHSYNAK